MEETVIEQPKTPRKKSKLLPIVLSAFLAFMPAVLGCDTEAGGGGGREKPPTEIGDDDYYTTRGACSDLSCGEKFLQALAEVKDSTLAKCAGRGCSITERNSHLGSVDTAFRSGAANSWNFNPPCVYHDGDETLPTMMLNTNKHFGRACYGNINVQAGVDAAEQRLAEIHQ